MSVLKNTKHLSDKKRIIVSAILRVGPYIYTEYFRSTPEEVLCKLDSWRQEKHQIIRMSITFDGKEYIFAKD